MGTSYSSPTEIESKHFTAHIASLPPNGMKGKNVAITGCTSGTGFIAAKVCVQLGALRVMMLNRASPRADAALKDLQAAASDGTQVSLVTCDLMSFASTREAAAALRAELGGEDGGLDVLCNNAGVMGLKDAATVDGADVQMQTNHLSHFLLTCEVWPLLCAAAAARGEARVVSHSSGARRGGLLEPAYLSAARGGDLGGDVSGWMPGTGGRWKRYQQSKLANVVFTYALRDRIAALAEDEAGAKVKALVAHPGLSATNLQVTTSADGGMGAGFTSFLMSRFAQSGEDGAMGLMRCCCDPVVSNGDFYGPKGVSGPAVLMPDDSKLAPAESRAMLWGESLKATGVADPLPLPQAAA